MNLFRYELSDYLKDLTHVGTCKIHHVTSSLLEIVIDIAKPTISDAKKNIFRKMIGVTVDNVFICDKFLDWVSKAGIDVIGTSARMSSKED